jgi:hypothetical protein
MDWGLIGAEGVFSNPIPILRNMMRLSMENDDIPAGIDDIRSTQGCGLSLSGSAGRRIRYY